MTSQKIENVLNLALDATQEERLRSGNLEVGYDEADNTWDVIILYSGTLDSVDRIAMDVIPLLKKICGRKDTGGRSGRIGFVRGSHLYRKNRRGCF